MGYRLGVDLGTSFTAATIGRAGSTQGASLGVDSAVVPSVVYIGADGGRLYGSAAADLAGAEPGRVLRGFVRRIGDETPMVPAAGASTAAHRVTADFVAWVVAQASVQEGYAPDAVAVTHPATWGPHKRELLAAALREAGIPGATLVAEPVAAATAGAAGRDHAAGAVVAVYDLGGRTFDAALVRRGADGAWAFIGRPAGLPDLGGADLDDLVLGHVLSGLTPDQQQALGQLDADDEATGTAMTGLRAACVKAKETLSTQTVATVEVKLPGIAGNVRLTRGEFESMINAAIESTIEVLDSVLDSAGLVAGDVDYVLIAGGSSRIPLVTQLLSRQFHVPVVTAGGQSPATAIAAGAVLSLGPIPVSAAPAVVPAAKAIAAKAAAKASAKATEKVAKPARKVAGMAPVVPGPAKPVTPAAPVATTQTIEKPAAEKPAVELPLPLPLPSPSGPTSKPIRPRRGSRRAEIVGLEGLAPVASARAAEAPVLDGPRAVVPARAVASVGVLLAEEPVRTVTMVRMDDMLPPPRPAMDDTGFEHYEDIEVVEVEQVRAAWSMRSVFSIRRSLALTVLTGAIYVGSTAWIPATPAITDHSSSSSTLQVASAKHSAP